VRTKIVASTIGTTYELQGERLWVDQSFVPQQFIGPVSANGPLGLVKVSVA
jgi:hypothetical protein